MNPVFPPDYLLLLTVTVTAVLLYLAWRSSGSLPLRRRTLLLGLRGAAVVALWIPFWNPGTWVQSSTGLDPVWPILLDRSASMQTEDHGNRDRLGAAEDDAAGLLSAIGETARPWAFAATLTPGLQSEPSNPSSSAIAAALDEMMNRVPAAVPIPAVFLLSDGRQIPPQSLEEVANRAAARAIPVYPLVYGGEILRGDLSLEARPVQVTIFNGQAAVLHLAVRSSGFPPVAVNVELLDANGESLAVKTVEVESDASAAVSFRVPGLPVGSHLLRARIQPVEGDTFRSNDETPVQITVTDQELRVLALEGAPHWDTKFIANLLREHSGFSLHQVQRVADGRYFEISPGEITRSGRETEQPFPEGRDALAAYDILLLGKGVEHFLDSSTLADLRWFVSDHGGVLVFSRGKAYHTEQPELARLEPLTWGPLTPGESRWHPTPAGIASGLFAGDLPGPEAEVWRKIPPVGGLRQVREVHGFAEVLLESAPLDGGAPSPAVAVRRFGKGVVVAVNSEGLWRWDFFADNPEASDFYRKLWLRLFQWSATQGDFLPGRGIALEVIPAAVPLGDAVRARLRIGPSSEARPAALELRSPDGVTRVPLPENLGPGDSAVHLWTPVEAGYHEVTVLDAEAAELGAPSVLQVIPPPTEDRDLSADRPAMEALAKRTGGRVITFDEAAAVIAANRDSLAAAEASGNSSWKASWDSVWILLAVVALLGAEWVVRRREGLS